MQTLFQILHPKWALLFWAISRNKTLFGLKWQEKDIEDSLISMILTLLWSLCHFRFPMHVLLTLYYNCFDLCPVFHLCLGDVTLDFRYTFLDLIITLSWPLTYIYVQIIRYCPIFQATCCADKLHCCPEGFQCDKTGMRCEKSGSSIRLTSTLFTRFKPAPPRELTNDANNVKCPDGKKQCPEGSTCCKTPTGQYTCCPFVSVSIVLVVKHSTDVICHNESVSQWIGFTSESYHTKLKHIEKNETSYKHTPILRFDPIIEYVIYSSPRVACLDLRSLPP